MSGNTGGFQRAQGIMSPISDSEFREMRGDCSEKDATIAALRAERDRLGEENERYRRHILGQKWEHGAPPGTATGKTVDDGIMVRCLIAQIELVAEAEINADNWYQLFKQANAAKRELRKMYHKAIDQSNDVFRGYSMALDDIGKIGEALGLNSSLYMTHSPRQVAGMVLKQAQKVTLEPDAAQQDARELASALCDAALLVADWGNYASDYFKEKHGYEDDLKQIGKMLSEYGAKYLEPEA